MVSVQKFSDRYEKGRWSHEWIAGCMSMSCDRQTEKVWGSRRCRPQRDLIQRNWTDTFESSHLHLALNAANLRKICKIQIKKTLFRSSQCMRNEWAAMNLCNQTIWPELSIFVPQICRCRSRSWYSEFLQFWTGEKPIHRFCSDHRKVWRDPHPNPHHGFAVSCPRLTLEREKWSKTLQRVLCLRVGLIPAEAKMTATAITTLQVSLFLVQKLQDDLYWTSTSTKRGKEWGEKHAVRLGGCPYLPIFPWHRQVHILGQDNIPFPNSTPCALAAFLVEFLLDREFSPSTAQCSAQSKLIPSKQHTMCSCCEHYNRQW